MEHTFSCVIRVEDTQQGGLAPDSAKAGTSGAGVQLATEAGTILGFCSLEDGEQGKQGEGMRSLHLHLRGLVELLHWVWFSVRIIYGGGVMETRYRGDL